MTLVKNSNIIKVLVGIFFIACSPKENSRHIEQNDDSVFSVPFSPKEKAPIILNMPPTNDDVDAFITSRTLESYENLCFRYLKSDLVFEEFFFDIVAVDKFKIPKGYYNLAGCLTNYFSYLSIGHHSKEIATFFLKKGAKNSALCRETLQSLSFGNREIDKLWTPDYNHENTILYLKAKSLMGDIDSYKRLKKILIETNQSEHLLYYSYLMVDRYDYKPAGGDFIYVLKENYKKYDLGELGEDANYLCSFYTAQ